MTQYHINDKGEAKPCMAKIKCRLGASWDEHYDNKKDAQRGYEKKQEKMMFLSANKKHQNNSLTDQALSSSLEYSGEIPQWLEKLNKNNGTNEDNQSEIIDVIDTSVGELAVVWSEIPEKDSDRHVVFKRGFNLNSIEYRNLETGEIKGYLKATYVDEKSSERAFGNDEYSALRAYTSRHLGTGIFDVEYDETNAENDITITPNDFLNDKEKRIESKKKVWANSYRFMHLTPNSFKERDDLDYGTKVYYNLSEKYAPNDEEKLDEEISEINKQYKELHDNNKRSYDTPFIDYSNLDYSLRGQGVGASMYVYAARKLSEKGLGLSASGTQTEEAQKAWKRMVSDKRLPIEVRTRRFVDEEGYDDYHDQRFVMDFTKNNKN